VGAIACLDGTEKRMRWAEARKRCEAFNAGEGARGGRRLRRGVGMSLVWHGAGFTGSGEVRLASLAVLELAPDGRPRVLAASTEIGQGTATMFAQLVGESLGVPASEVIVHDPDTGVVPDSGPTVASRTCMVVGGLLARAGTAMREKLELFAERPIAGGDDFRRVAKRWLKERGPLKIERRYEKPPGIAWDDGTYQGDAYGVFSYAGFGVEVEVDLDTWETRLIRAVTAHDIGRAIHPVLAAGQVEGGLVQGLGWALLEEVRWKDGRVWNHQLTNYIIPTSADCPPIEVEFVDNPYAHGPFGAKGVGELPMDAPAPAVIAAIAHATGRWLDEIPATPERLRRAAEREPGHTGRVRIEAVR
jgi:CO/xanthine dehydrogenase Mo-binding subunit